jgi:hypothetical protein
MTVRKNVSQLTDAELAKLYDERDRLKTKLDLPCGSCHPCENWAPQTWRNAGRRIPHVIEWDDLAAEAENADELAETIQLMTAELATSQAWLRALSNADAERTANGG